MSVRPPRRLSPLCAALAAAMPLLCLGDLQAATPAPAQVPVPAVTWRVNGTGAAAPVNVVNNKGGVDQTIKQTSQRAIYQWQSFDIGASSSVHFDMAQTGASALNRVTGSTAPSQIFGKLSASKQGEIYLINANGILFGKGSVVNTGSLIASTLNISDTEFNSGLVNHLVYNPTSPAFVYEGAPEDFIDAKNFVRVEQGAALTTDGQGGRVFLFAKRVENAGSISTPGGQTVLAAGGSVYLQNPASNKLYASEANAEVPTLRGLLVEVGNGPGTSPEGGRGSVANLATGTIDTARGNTTLVGMAVNQSGIVRATTSVTENGSIILRAQGRAQPNNVSASATASGDLVLGAGSLTTITPDTELNADGTVKTSDGNATYVNPRIDLAGKTVLLDKGAQVIAPGASVYVRAEVTPSYEPRNAVNYIDGNSDARVVMAEGSVIDVAGTTDTEVDVSRYFVTTELLGSNDLKDAPLQKDGLLYRSQATVDVRDDSEILGSLQSYRNTLQQSITERLSAGGKVSLSAEGAVLTHASSRIDVSGGRVKVAGSEVRATQLMASDGTLYDLNNAPADLVYSHAINLNRSASTTYDRWGSQVSYGTVSSTRTEAGYVEGRAAGSLTVVAPIVALDGQLAAHVEAGGRQTQGLDSRATGGALTIGAVQQGTQDFTSSTYAGGAVLQSFNVSGDGIDPDKLDQVWADPLKVKLAVDLSLASGMRRSVLTDAGFATVAIAAEGNVRFSAQTADAAVTLADQGSLRLLSTSGTVTLGGQTTIHGGSVELISKAGAVALVDGAGVNLSGKFYNQALDGPLDTAAATGGTFSAKAATALTLGSNSLVNVSGGAIVSEAGKLSGANAGSIGLNHSAITEVAEPGLVLQGRLEGYSLATGGSLSLAAPQVLIGAATGTEPTGTQQFDTGLFTQGGFSSYSVDGRLNLDVAAGTTVAPTRDGWTVDSRPAALLPSGGSLNYDTRAGTLAVSSDDGSTPTQIGHLGLEVGEFAKPVSLALSASGLSSQAVGALTVGEGATLQMVDQSSLSLKAANRLLMLGDATSHGGKISLSISNQLTSPLTESTWLWVGENSQLDVSGVAQLVTGTNGLTTGKVLDGGSISLSTAATEEAAAASLVLQRGARLVAHGTSAQVDQTLLTATGKTVTRITQTSNGGNVAIVSNGNLLLEGALDLQAGGAASTGAKGGSLSVTLAPGRDEARTGSQRNLPRQLTLSTNRTDVTSGVDVSDSAALALALSEATAKANVSTRLVEESGAADLTLSATESIRLFDNPDLKLSGTLTLNTQALVMASSTAAPAATAAVPATARLEAAQIVLNAPRPRASTPAITQPEASVGDAELSLVSRGGLTLAGQWVTSGVGQLTLQSAGDLMLQGASGSTPGNLAGGLDTRADVTLSARQISVASDTDFVINTPDHALVITAGDRSAEKPLSAGASLTVHAATIEQAGVLRLPQGQIQLQATEQLSLLAGSETSVSAQGLDITYGTTTNDLWTAPDGSTLNEVSTKRVDLAAPAVSVADGATVDLSAGGDLKAYEFVAGKGGSSDVFAGDNGAYALLPGVHTAASYDTSIAGAAAQGRLMEIGSGGPLPAGVYTLLPARYAATQPGAFLVKPSTGTAAYDLGTAVTQADGSTLIGARLLTEGSQAYSQPSTWVMTPQSVALKSSEIRTTSANAEFASRASVAGVARPELVLDAGTLSVAATTAALDGEFDFAVLRDQAGAALGRGGRAEFAASRIQVVNTATSTEGVLSLTAAQLNQLGADSVLLGATSGASADGVTALTVAAETVVFAQGQAALTVPDLLAVSSDQVQVQAAARFQPAMASGGVSPTAYAVVGDGAGLRVSRQAGGSLTRTGVTGEAGGLQVAAGASFDTTGVGSVVLDSSGTTRIDPSVALSAADLVLASKVISVGGVSNDLQMAITPALAASVADASSLTLRAYTHIDFKEGTTLGSESLSSLVLDTPRLRVVEATGPLGAQVVAGEITLTSTSANVSGAVAGAGQLSLHASDAAGGTGLIRLDDGQMVVNGAAEVQLTADRGVMFSGEQRLGTAGDLTLTAPLLAASENSAASALVAGGSLNLQTNGRANQGLPTAAQGASLDLKAQAVEINSRIVLPSGEVQVQADGDVSLGASGRINVAGQRTVLDGETVDLGGGSVSLQSHTGDLNLAAGSVVNVSATGGAAAGSLQLQAPEGSVLVRGQLLGSSETGRGASLTVDSGEAFNLNALAGQLLSSTGAAEDFTESFSLRQRQGSVTLADDKALRSRQIALSADAGNLLIDGGLDARAASGGRIDLAAGANVRLREGSVVDASATSAAGAGGQLTLSSVAGRVALEEGSQVNLSAGAQASSGSSAAAGGRLTLRAARVGGSDGEPDTNVAIDPLAATLSGVRSIEVEGVKTYNVSGGTVDGLLAQQIASDNLAFVGPVGGKATAMASRLAAGNAALQDLIKVHAGAELQAEGDLTVNTGGDWRLSSETASVTQHGGDTAHVGDSSLTVRSTGTMRVQNGIRSGLDFSDTATHDGGSITLVAGADLSAAARSAVQRGSAAALEVGVNGQQVSLLTSTGDISLAAAGAVNMVRGEVTIASLGVETDDEVAAAAREQGQGSNLAYHVDGGRVDVSAGTDVLGRYYFRDGVVPHPTQWTQTGGIRSIKWWGASQFEFEHGVASFGGGDVVVSAGRDVRNLVVAAPSSGVWTVDANGAASTAHRFGGGSVFVQAGRDLVNGVVQAGGAELVVAAGRDIAFVQQPGQLDADARGLTVAYDNTAVEITARRDAEIGSVQSSFALAGHWISGQDADASLRAVATSGDLTLRNGDEPDRADGTTGSVKFMMLPGRSLLAAPSGSVQLGGFLGSNGTLLQLAQRADASFSVLAGQDLALADQVRINAAHLASGSSYYLSDAELALAFSPDLTLSRADQGQLDGSTRESVHLVAEAGDIDVTARLTTARPLRMVAGQDVTLNADTSSIEIQHQASDTGSELSLIQAGRDLQLNSAGILIGGDGDLVLLAGRDIDLGIGAGVVANGNNDNPTLQAAKSAAITLVAGLRSDGADYSQATAQGFQAVGSTALAAREGDLYALLTAEGATMPALGSPAATAFEAQGTDAQLSQVQSLLGVEPYQAAVARYVRSLPGNADLSNTAALQAFAGLSADLRQGAVGQILSAQLGSVASDRRVAFLSAVALADTRDTAMGLVEWMSAQTGRDTDLAEAIRSFDALPLERQLIWLNKVLVDEVRTNARAAVSASSSAEQTLAYGRAYAALDTVFPLDRPSGSVRMPQSTLRTLQGGDITIMAPGGGVNAGESTGGSASAASLGVVTVGGGAISALVRDDFLVNQSRVFTLAQGDILLWSSAGDIDAGRGGKTVVGAPAPVYKLDDTGRVVVDTSGSFSGSGIAVLNEASSLDLYAPAGAIDAGEAGIRAVGNVVLGAQVVRGADDIKGGSVAGAPVVAANSASVAGLTTSSENTTARSSDDEEEQRRKRNRRRTLLLEFLGFGRG